MRRRHEPVTRSDAWCAEAIPVTAGREAVLWGDARRTKAQSLRTPKRIPHRLPRRTGAPGSREHPQRVLLAPQVPWQRWLRRLRLAARERRLRRDSPLHESRRTTTYRGRHLLRSLLDCGRSSAGGPVRARSLVQCAQGRARQADRALRAVGAWCVLTACADMLAVVPSCSRVWVRHHPEAPVARRSAQGRDRSSG